MRDGKESGFKTSRSTMRTTVVDLSAKLAVMNGIVQVNEPGSSARSIHGWLKAHMEEHPTDRYELVIGDKVVIELTAGDASRADLTQKIIDQFDSERMNFGEDLRIRLITISALHSGKVDVKQEVKAVEGKPSEQELFHITRLSKSELEAIVDASLTEPSWKVVVAYSELVRRLRQVDPKTTNSFLMLAKIQGYSDADAFVVDAMSRLGHADYLSLLKHLNESGHTDNKRAQVAVSEYAASSTSSVTSEVTRGKGSTPWYKRQSVWVVLGLMWLIGLAIRIMEEHEAEMAEKRRQTECLNRELEIKKEIIRTHEEVKNITQIVYMREPEVEFIGNCLYRVTEYQYAGMDDAYYQSIRTLDYRLGGEWVKVDEETYVAVNGEWVRKY